MNHDQLAIRAPRDEMIGESLQAGGHVDAELVHAREMAELLDRTGHIGEDGGQPAAGKTFGAPNVSDQRTTFLCDLTSRVNREDAVVDEFSRLNLPGKKANDDKRQQARRGI